MSRQGTAKKKSPLRRDPSGCPVLLESVGRCGTRWRSNSHSAYSPASTMLGAAPRKVKPLAVVSLFYEGFMRPPAMREENHPYPLPEKLEACLENICMATVNWRWCFAIFNPCANIVKHQTGFLVEIPVQANREIGFLATLNSLTV